jgi:nucleoside 2-deoxyribosyltransferase
MCNRIVKSDIAQIFSSDGIVAFYEKEKGSIGTPMEIFFNGYILGKPTYVITKTTPEHPWFKSIATEIFKTPYDFEKFIG